MCVLRVTHKPGGDYETVELDGLTTILVGRIAASDILLNYKFISRIQCGFALFPLNREPVWIVKDGSLIDDKRNSSYGTYVNGCKLGDIEIKELKSGDVISFADHTYPNIVFYCRGEIDEKVGETFSCWLGGDN